MEGKDVNIEAIIRAARNVAKDTPDVKIMSDIDAAKIQRAYNKEVGYVPPALPAPMKQIEYEGKTMGELQEGGGIDPYNMPDMPLRVEDFDIIPDSKLGANEGSIITHKHTGDKWYYKSPKNSELAMTEWVSSVIAKRLIGDTGPRVRLISRNGKVIGIASKWVKGKRLTTSKLRALKVSNPKEFKTLLRSFAVHAWLGNKEWANPKNLIVDGGGHIRSIDTGGSLLKDLDHTTLTELFAFLDGRNPHIKAILECMTPYDFMMAMRKVWQIADEELADIFLALARQPGMTPTKARALLSALKQRRDRLAAMENWIFQGQKVEGVKFDWAGFPSKLRKAWFKLSAGKKDLSWTGVDVTDAATGFNKLKNLSLLAEIERKALGDTFKTLTTMYTAERYIFKQLQKIVSTLTPEERHSLHLWREGGRFQEALNQFTAAFRTGKLLTSGEGPDLVIGAIKNRLRQAQATVKDLIDNKQKYLKKNLWSDSHYKSELKKARTKVTQLETELKKPIKPREATFGRAGYTVKELLTAYKNLLSAIEKYALDDSYKMFVAKNTFHFQQLRHYKFGIHRLGEETGLIGKHISSDTFLNASFNYRTADVFRSVSAESKGLRLGEHPVMLEIMVPKETKMAFVDSAKQGRAAEGDVELGPNMFTHLDEAEIIMHPDTQILVHDARWVTFSKGKNLTGKTLKITGEVVPKGEKPISTEAQLAAAQHNQYENKSIITADVKLEPYTSKLSKREEILKVEKAPHEKYLKDILEMGEDIKTELKNKNVSHVNDDIVRINNEFKDQTSKNTLLGKAYDAVKNCIMGKL